MPEEDVKGIIIEGSSGGKIRPTSVEELERAGDDTANWAVGEIDGSSLGSVDLAADLRCTVVQGSRSPVQRSSSVSLAKPTNRELLCTRYDTGQPTGFDTPVIIRAVGDNLR